MANEQTFRCGIMVSENVNAYLGSTKLFVDEVSVEINDGALVVLGDLIENTPYMQNGNAYYDYNVYASSYPAAVTDPVVIVDISDISQGDIAGNRYKEGIKLFGLKSNPAYPVRYRVPQKHDKFWISADCIEEGTPVVGNYLVPTIGSGLFTLETEAPEAAGFVCKVVATRDFTTGVRSNGKLYLCQVIDIA